MWLEPASVWPPGLCRGFRVESACGPDGRDEGEAERVIRVVVVDDEAPRSTPAWTAHGSSKRLNALDVPRPLDDPFPARKRARPEDPARLLRNPSSGPHQAIRLMPRLMQPM
ncbi:hypothetical protein GCM10010228_41890 [Streptomyces massasporeus]|nr:hypothetical protein GCM10010228_41890 [Streptomyces massasporeus]